MKKALFKTVLCLAMAAVLTLGIGMNALAATTVTPIDGISVTDTVGTGSLSGTTVTITATGNLLAKKTNTVTITNETGSAGTLSFAYAAKTYSAFTVGGTAASASGSYTKPLDAGETITVVITSNSGWSGTTATLTLSDFTFEKAAESADVTVAYNSSLGAVTAAGAAVSNGHVATGVTSAGLALSATPNSGCSFLGWINTANNMLLSTETSYTAKPTGDMEVKAIFAGASAAPVLWADNGYKLFDDLSAAASYAQSATNKVITLAANATLSESCTIPSGVTLLIPFDDNNTLYTTMPALAGEDTYVKPTIYRTLTMASGANLTVNGSVSISAKMSGKMGGTASAPTTANGAPSGPVGHIQMQEGSQISVESGGVLYTWGFISGSGAVEAKDGATVYECFQMGDWRGGNATTTILGEDDTYGVFPFSQYFVQNIEVPLTLHAGATEYANTGLYVSYVGGQQSSVPFVGDSASKSMFKITSGYIVKDFIEGQGRLKITICGDVAASTMSMSMKISLIGTQTVDTSKFDLPINGGMTVDIQSGNITVNQDLLLHPGSEFYVREGAKITMGTGNRIIAMDYDQWRSADSNIENGAQGGFISQYDVEKLQALFTVGANGMVGKDKDAFVQIDGEVDASAGYVYATQGGAKLFSTGTGKVTINAAGTDSTIYMIRQNGTNVAFPPITIEPAKLQDGDGTYVDAATAGTYTYCADTQKWCTPGHRYAETVLTEATCTQAGAKANVCIACGEQQENSLTQIPATGHTVVTDAAVDATCTTAGLTEGSHCSACGEILVAQEQILPLAHTVVTDAAVDATCTTDGLTEGSHCSVCNTVLVAQETISATGHTVVTDAAVAATCTTDGLTEGSHCSACGEVLVAQDVIPATGHTEVTDAAVAATCTTDGLTEGSHCSACGEVLVAQEAIPATGHTEVTDAAVAATCTTAGKSEGSHCSVCKAVLVAQETVPATGHTEVTDAAVAATCTTAGKSEGSHCSVCKVVLVAQETIPATGHTEVTDAAVAATCTTAGLTEGSHCSVCKVVLVAQETVPATGHTYGQWIVTQEATYTQTGSRYQTCSCGDTVTQEIPVLTHPITLWNVSLGGSIQVNFEMTLAEGDVVTVTVNGEPVEAIVADSTYSVVLAAAQMNDTIAFQVNGLPLAKDYSVRKYADLILADPDYSQTTKNLVMHMLNYGAASQIYFDINTGDLANDGITLSTSYTIPATCNGAVVEGTNESVRFYGASLVHKDRIAVRFYFVADEAFTVEGAEVIAKDGLYYVEIANINPQNLGDAVSVTVGDMTVSYSPLDYMVRMNNKSADGAAIKTLIQALYGYYQASVAYIDSIELPSDDF